METTELANSTYRFIRSDGQSIKKTHPEPFSSAYAAVKFTSVTQQALIQQRETPNRIIKANKKKDHNLLNSSY